MNKGIYEIKSNINIANGIYKMIIEGDTSSLTKPGQFVNIAIDGLFLRRPISVCDWDESTITLIYKVVGKGTEKMSQYQPTQKLDLLTGLGNGFDMSQSGQAPLIIGGGVGVPPMYGLAKRLCEQGIIPTVIIGFNGKQDIFYEDEFKELGARVYVTTADGSYGIKGFVNDAMEQCNIEYTYFYCCGPEPMLKTIYNKTNTSGQLSFEERMGCGFGACMGCSCKTKYGNKRICKEGPVLVKEEIIW